jgi:hypothetical protein
MQMVFNLSHSFFLLFDYLLYEKFEDIKGVIRIRKLYYPVGIFKLFLMTIPGSTSIQ